MEVKLIDYLYREIIHRYRLLQNIRRMV